MSDCMLLGVLRTVWGWVIHSRPTSLPPGERLPVHDRGKVLVHRTDLESRQIGALGILVPFSPFLGHSRPVPSRQQERSISPPRILSRRFATIIDASR